jgi:hypothetical protein
MTAVEKALEAFIQENRQGFREIRRGLEDLRDAQDRTQKNLDQLSREMAVFKQQTGEQIEESRKQRDADHKRWVEIAAGLGIIAEGLARPSVGPLLAQYSQSQEEPLINASLKVQHPSDRSRRREFDVVAVFPDVWMIAEAKTKLRVDDITQFAGFLRSEAREYFPEMAGRRLLGCIAAIHAEADKIAFAERIGLLVLVPGGDFMEPANSPGFVPAEF